jgi:hypothetical protein
MLQLLTLAGTPTDIGRQHGRLIRRLRPLLARVMAARLAELRRLGADRPDVLYPVHAALEAYDRPLLAFLAGLAETLELPPDDLLTYTLSSYLRDLFKVTHTAPRATLAALNDECTVWAAAAPHTAGGAPILAKNRDYHADHIPLQLLAQINPAHGYRYLTVGSAGSPHVFSSGINERGLAVADTHVLSTDIGPGLPRFSLMRELLEHHATTRSALDYLREAPHMGAGTLILADAHGHLALCESGHRRCGYLEAGPGADAYLAGANHFATPELAAHWVEDEPPLLQGNSPARRSRVLAALAAAPGRVDVAWAQALMSAHGTPQDAICRHAIPATGQPSHAGFESSTISSVIFLPRGFAGGLSAAPAAWLADGPPCLAAWKSIRVGLSISRPKP